MAEVEREAMEFDGVIVGAGPAGLSAAIRLKQPGLAIEVCALEKRSEAGAHILSGAAFDPVGLIALLPNCPMPPLMSSRGSHIVSMGNVRRRLGEQAEELEADVLPGMACSEIVCGANGEVAGAAAGLFNVPRTKGSHNAMLSGIAAALPPADG